jgi:hypothetical protein
MRENTKLIFQTLKRKWEHTTFQMESELEFTKEVTKRPVEDVIKDNLGVLEEDYLRNVKGKEEREVS